MALKKKPARQDEMDIILPTAKIPAPDEARPRILGVDPGTRVVGWGVIEKRGRGFSPLGAGAITTKGLKSIPERLERIYDELFRVIELYQPAFAGVETTFMDVSHANVKSVIAMGQGRGIALLACQKGGLTLREFSPATIKQAVTGNGQANKEQVRDMIVRLLNLKTVPRPLDVSDALAIAWTVGQRVRLTGRLKPRRRKLKPE